MKKILLIHTGGTFGMSPVVPGEELAPGQLQDQILTYVPEIEKIADIHVKIPFNLDSSNIHAPEWDLLAQLVYDNEKNYDGFVIIHGTDTMAYTASALSFSLLNFRKPVVLTGAQRPLSQLRNDARSNLIDSIELATMGIPEVMIVFGQRVLRGNRSKKINISSYDAFDSPNYPYLGRIGVKIEIDEKQIRSVTGTPLLLPGFREQVVVLNAQPSLEATIFENLLDANVRAFIILGFGAGNLPATYGRWIDFITKAIDQGNVVFVGSQSVYGGIDLNLYECGKQALRAGARGIGKMTLEAAYVKLQKILKLTSDQDAIYDKFFQNWAGEI